MPGSVLADPLAYLGMAGFASFAVGTWRMRRSLRASDLPVRPFAARVSFQELGHLRRLAALERAAGSFGAACTAIVLLAALPLSLAAGAAIVLYRVAQEVSAV